MHIRTPDSRIIVKAFEPIHRY